MLGGFLEVIALQFALALLYFMFRVIETRDKVLRKSSAFVLSLCLGLGISAFYLGPVMEYLTNSFSGHAPGTGLSSFPLFLAITYFVPYFMRGVQSYWTSNYHIMGNPWDVVTGHIGIASLFLTLLGAFSFFNMNHRRNHRRLMIFFLVVDLLALAKTFGAPIVNLIGYLPVFDSISFVRYLGTIWIFGFSVTDAFGAESLLSGNARAKHVLSSSMLVLLVVMGLASFSVPFVLPLNGPGLQSFYPTWRLLEAVLFLFALAICALKISKDQGFGNFAWLAGIVIIELSSYLPLALPYPTEALRSLFNLLMLLALTCWLSWGCVKPLGFKAFSLSRLQVLGLIVIIALLGQTLIASTSPYGLPERYDAFKEAPYITFLSRNAGLARVYSMDGALGANFAGNFGLFHIGIFSGINVNSFHGFVVNDLDPGSYWPMFVGYFRQGNTTPADELRENARFYDFLGVKYIVTAGTNLSDLYPVVYRDQTATIYENHNAFPRVFVVGSFEVAKSAEEAQLKIRAPTFDSRREVVLTTSPECAQSLEGGRNIDGSSAEIVSYDPSNIAVRAHLNGPGLLVLTDTYYPGWTASVDGKDTAIYQADGLVRAVCLDQGDHRVEFGYFQNHSRSALQLRVLQL